MTLTATSFRPPRHFDNAADWVHDLGDIPLQRIIFDPWPGTATEADLLLLVERDKRLCELIDGTLVEKPVGLFESLIAVNLIVELGAFVKRMGLGAVFGPDGTFRLQSSVEYGCRTFHSWRKVACPWCAQQFQSLRRTLPSRF